MKKPAPPTLKNCFSLLFAVALLALSACSSGPRSANWQLDAKAAMDGSVTAYLEGNSRLEALEFSRAKTALSSTGRADLLATAELLHCASHVASLVFEPCVGFEKLRLDVGPELRAYADYLAGQLKAQDLALLPADQRMAFDAVNSSDIAVLADIKNPLSQLLALALAFQAGRASPLQIERAVNLASSQGWRRPLLAWLGLELALAQASVEQGGDAAKVARLQRRIALVQAASVR